MVCGWFLWGEREGGVKFFHTKQFLLYTKILYIYIYYMAHLSVHTRPCKLAASMPHSLSHRKSSYLSDDFYYWVYPVCISTLMCFVWSVHMLVTAAEQKYSRSCIVSLCSSSRGIFMVGTVHSSYFYLFQGIKIGVCPLSSQKTSWSKRVCEKLYL